MDNNIMINNFSTDINGKPILVVEPNGDKLKNLDTNFTGVQVKGIKKQGEEQESTT
jgi:hypothetical protein